MKVLVIPDVHMKPRLFNTAQKLLKDGVAERAVCLMDLPDDWDREMMIDLYKDTFDRAISFAKTFPDTLWCYGNHDISYPWGRLETGYSPYAERTVIAKLEELKAALPDPSQLTFIHRIDNVLFMHGGLSTAFVRSLGEDMLDADIDEVISAVNAAPEDVLWNDESPLWLRPQFKDIEMYRADTYTQVVGHTPIELVFEKNGVISTDVFSTYRNGRQIGASEMVVIDTQTREYDLITVE